MKAVLLLETGDKGLNPRHMKSGMNTEGTGQEKTHDFGNKERADKARGKFAGLHLEVQVTSGQPYPMPETIPGSIGGPLVVDTRRWS